MSRKAPFLALFLFVAALGVAGCGGGSSSSSHIPTLSDPLAGTTAGANGAAGQTPTAIVSPASVGAGNPGVGNNGNDKPVGNAQGNGGNPDNGNNGLGNDKPVGNAHGEPHRPPSDTPDTTAPVVTITAPTEGWYQTSTLPALAYTVVDDLDPSPTVVVTGWSTGEGQFTVVVTAADAAGNVGSDSVAYGVDNTPPAVTANAAPPANGAGWNNTTVTVTFTADDPGGSGVASVDPPVVVMAEGTTPVTGTATDLAGNVGTASLDVRIDVTGPAVELTAPYDGAIYVVGEPVPASFGASDLLSDIDSVVGTVPDGELIDTATIGSQSFTVTATDAAGNATTVTVTYAVGSGL